MNYINKKLNEIYDTKSPDLNSLINIKDIVERVL